MAVPVAVRTCWLFADAIGWTVDGEFVPVTYCWLYGCTHKMDGVQPYCLASLQKNVYVLFVIWDALIGVNENL